MNSEELEGLSCADCPDGRRSFMRCPDLALEPRPDDDLIRLGGRGSDHTQDSPHAFDRCPAYWTREPSMWGLDLPWAVDVRSAHHLAIEARFAYEHGALGAAHDALPGKLHDAIFLLLGEEARITRVTAAKQQREQKHRGSHVTVTRWA